MSLLERVRAHESEQSNPGDRVGSIFGSGKTGDSALSPVPLAQVRDGLAGVESTGTLRGAPAGPIPEWRKRQLREFARRGRVIERIYY